MSAGQMPFPDGGGFVPGLRYGTFSFQCNAASNPLVATWGGSLKKKVVSVVYAATGIFTVTFVKGFVFPTLPIFELSNSCADVTGTNSFYAVQTGVATQVAGIMTFVIQALSAATTPFQPPATAGNRINFSLEGVDETAV